MGRIRRSWLWAVLAFSVAALVLWTGLSVTVTVRPGGVAEASRDTALSSEATEILTRTGQALAEVADRVRPSVVSIITTKVSGGEAVPGFAPFFNDPFFRRFFGDRFGQDPHFKTPERKQQGLGSGVIVDPDGYILTNNHVVEGADEIKVVLSDGREFKGELIGTDPKTDLAVVRIEAGGLRALELGDSDALRVGEIVVAVGNPYRLSLTVTMGIVSAKGRANVGIADYEDFIQTDAAINPGNSGGAMVNARGELVGINTAIFSTSGGYQGIGFAIPSNMARNVMNQLLQSGKVVRGWLGVAIQAVTPALAEQFGLDSDRGVLVSDVMKDGPAREAGIERGDVIVSLDGKEVDAPYSLRNRIAATPPGTVVELGIVRDGRKRTVRVKLGELDADRTRVGKSVSGYDNVLRGVTVEDLTPQHRRSLKLPEDMTGVVVTDVAAGAPAEGVLVPGDVLIELNRKAIGGVRDYEAMASELDRDASILLLVYRKGNTIYLTLSK